VSTLSADLRRRRPPFCPRHHSVRRPVRGRRRWAALDGQRVTRRRRRPLAVASTCSPCTRRCHWRRRRRCATSPPSLRRRSANCSTTGRVCADLVLLRRPPAPPGFPAGSTRRRRRAVTTWSGKTSRHTALRPVRCVKVGDDHYNSSLSYFISSLCMSIRRFV